MKVVLVLALALFSQLSLAYELPMKDVSMQMKNTGMRDVLEGILVESGLGYDIDPQITNDNKISVTVRGPWAKIFQRVLSDAKLTYGFDRDGKILVIKN